VPSKTRQERSLKLLLAQPVAREDEEFLVHDLILRLQYRESAIHQMYSLFHADESRPHPYHPFHLESYARVPDFELDVVRRRISPATASIVWRPQQGFVADRPIVTPSTSLKGAVLCFSLTYRRAQPSVDFLEPRVGGGHRKHASVDSERADQMQVDSSRPRICFLSELD
jgi:hypothetical protein